jgi:hypothetical protein
MKRGDKVWVFDYFDQEIEEGSCVQVIPCFKRTYITIEFKLPNGSPICNGGYILGKDCFPTREALCEHYRKIFE